MKQFKNTGESLFALLGRKVIRLPEFLTFKFNVHQAIKNRVTTICVLYNNTKDEKNASKKASVTKSKEQ